MGSVLLMGKKTVRLVSLTKGLGETANYHVRVDLRNDDELCTDLRPNNKSRVSYRLVND